MIIPHQFITNIRLIILKIITIHTLNPLVIHLHERSEGMKMNPIGNINLFYGVVNKRKAKIMSWIKILKTYLPRIS